MNHHDQSRGGVEFISLARNLLLSKGFLSDAVYMAESDPRTPQRVVSVLKAAVAFGTTSDPTWAGNLADARIMSDAFIESLRQLSVFDRLAEGGMRRVPLNTRIGVITSIAEGTEVAEAALSPVTKFALAGPTLEPRKVVGTIVVTQELLDSAVRGGEGLLASELRMSVARATNSAFLFGITNGAPEFPSAGSTAAQILADVEALLDAVKPTAFSRLYLIVDANTAGKLATKAGTDGHAAFPDMSPLGGMLAGIPVLVADDVTEDTTGHSMVLVDAAAIAGNSDVVVLDTSEHATIQINDAPISGASAVPTSLWQSNLAAMKVVRWFGYELLRADGVAVITGVNY